MCYAYKVVASPMGDLKLVASEKGLVAVLWPNDNPARVKLLAPTENTEHPMLVEAARQLTRFAAAKKDRGERCDLEAGMAKLFATETALEVSMDAMRVLGANGYSTDFPVERYMREAKIMQIFEGTNQIQRLVISRHLAKS